MAHQSPDSTPGTGPVSERIRALLQSGATTGGFDLTDFGDADTFAALLDRFGLEYVGHRDEIGDYVWANDDGLYLRTYANPISAEFARSSAAGISGYADHISLGGPEIDAHRLYRAIRVHASSIKHEHGLKRRESGSTLIPEAGSDDAASHLG